MFEWLLDASWDPPCLKKHARGGLPPCVLSFACFFPSAPHTQHCLRALGSPPPPSRSTPASYRAALPTDAARCASALAKLLLKLLPPSAASAHPPETPTSSLGRTSICPSPRRCSESLRAARASATRKDTWQIKVFARSASENFYYLQGEFKHFRAKRGAKFFARNR